MSDKPTTEWAYARVDGEEMFGDYRFMTGADLADVKSLASDYAEDHDEPPVMVVYEMRPVAVGRPIIEVGEDLGDGDKEPDEFKGLEWEAG